MNYALGINLNHDSSAALMNLSSGKIEIALQEERLTRIKFQHGFPENCIKHIQSNFDSQQISKTIVGSHSIFESPRHLNRDELGILKYLLMVNSYNYFDISNSEIPPDWWSNPLNNKILESNKFSSTENWFIATIESYLQELGINSKVENVNHHQSHMYSAISNFSKTTLIFTLDGEGDHESGTVHIYDPSMKSHPKKIASFPIKNSIGNLYSSVTETYGLKKSKHEGKITGLAAFGNSNLTLPRLKRYLFEKSGHPYFGRHNHFSQKFVIGIGRDLLQIISKDYEQNLFQKEWRNWKWEIHDLFKSTNFADLAAGMQKLSEEVSLSIVKHWIRKTGINNIALSGGVFSNVKINQVLAEDEEVGAVSVYPNMGDAGTAIGGLLKFYREKFDFEEKPSVTNSIYLGPNLLGTYKNQNEIIRQTVSISELPTAIAMDLVDNKIIGFVTGRMEWGPRALGNRSILANPANSTINAILNQRLERTEYMPFAPATISELFSDVYEISQHVDLEPFKYMAMACKVKSKWAKIMPAVIHVDGTARPQLVTDDNKIYHALILKFFELTGIPAVINTSFNAHEEPIVVSMENCIKNLIERRIDILYVDNQKFTLNENS
jgi:carbamoyltransferase